MNKCEELVRIVETLPADYAQEVLDFASFLAEKAHMDDEEWDRMTSDPKYAPKLRAMISKCEKEIAEGRFRKLQCK